MRRGIKESAEESDFWCFKRPGLVSGLSSVKKIDLLTKNDLAAV
jgi:hypothetical protein